MRLLTVLTVMTCLVSLSLAKGRCGLSCFRWQKCMGVLDGGSNRPGQLGDTGIIVLQKCGDLKKKGCECALPGEEKTTTTTEKTTTPRSSRPRSLFSPSNRKRFNRVNRTKRLTAGLRT